LREGLGDAAFAAIWEAGRAMSWWEVIEAAFSDMAERDPEHD
jgi:hypothetical protein